MKFSQLSAAFNTLLDNVLFREKRIIPDLATGGSTEIWMLHGSADREDGPAYRQINAEGRTIRESWLRGGRLHRTDGPAVIKYNPKDGSVVSQEWWEESHRIPDYKRRYDVRYDPQA